MYGTISFPGLGLSFNPSRIAFSIGSKPIYWYGIIIAAGFLLAVYYAMKRADQFGLTQDNIIDMLICAVPLAIIGARAYYCIFSWGLYKDDPIRVLYIWEGGLAIYGGVIGAVIGLFIYTKVKKVKTSAILDIGGLGPVHWPLGQLYEPGGVWCGDYQLPQNGAHRRQWGYHLCTPHIPV